MSFEMSRASLCQLRCSGQDKYRPRKDENGTPGGEGFLHYTADGQYVTVASGKGDPTKDGQSQQPMVRICIQR